MKETKNKIQDTNKSGFTPTPRFGVSLRSKRGFTLIEVILAVTVITTALVACISLISFSVSGIRLGKSKLLAVNLAQEGIEIVRNIRDSNWLGPNYKRAPSDWRDDLEENSYEVQYDDTSLFRTYSGSGNYLNIDSAGFYQYDTGNSTSFKRKITINHIDNNQIKVVSEITWQEKGRAYSIQAEDRLYNWLEEEE